MIFNISYKFLILAAALAALFALFPGLDLGTAALFYRHDGFYLARNEFVLALYHSVPLVSVGFCLLTLAVLLHLLFTRKDHFFRLERKHLVFLLLAFALGPGLVVNWGLKNHYGRARPAQVTQFGGSKRFTRAFEISDQDRSNGSFVCGHASVGFFFLTPGLLFSGRRRNLTFLGAGLYGVLVGWARMAQGAHFLSDVVFAFVFVYLTSKVLHSVMFPQEAILKERIPVTPEEHPVPITEI
jgi:lipid A 4'-phosphatase